MLCAVYLLSREGAMLTGKSITEEKGLILIDSGHGGIDPGVVGIGGVKEKDINLKIAKELAGALEKKGYKAVLIRKDDNGLYDAESKNKKVQDMQKRCAMIKEEKPLLTVSIHQNSYPSGEVHGAQVFYYQGSQKGKQLADCVQSSLVENLDPDNHRVAKANSDYFLLRDNPYVTVIAECGFLSNEEEKQKLEDKAYQEKAAQAIYKGIQSYLSQEK